MPSDRSRTSGGPSGAYRGPVFQQGRVILDRDFNELREAVSGRTDADALDFVGPCGTPDDGFAVSLGLENTGGGAGTTSPPANPFDFLIRPGTMYVGGQRAFFPARPKEAGASYRYFDQPDWAHPDDPTAADPSSPASASPSPPTQEVIVLRVFEQEVGAVEDPDLLEVALGGPDTTGRLRLMRRVERLPGTDCQTAPAGFWAGLGFRLDEATARLVPQAALQVGFTQAPSTADTCDPVAQGGYLGAENQLIRVQIAKVGGQLKLLWGYDNASFLYRVSARPDGTTLQLSQTPVDAYHQPKSGQTVEVLRTGAVLGSELDESDPSAARAVPRCVAEASGQVATLAQSYNPDDGTVVLDQVVEPHARADTTPLFLRVWQSALDLPDAGGTIELTDEVSQSTTGIQVTITAPQAGGGSGPLPLGAYWMIAVRPGTPQAVYPGRLLESPQPPDGPRQWLCPLAEIDWSEGGSVTSCTLPFDNLVELTARKAGGGCCTRTVGPQDITAGNTLQSILNDSAKRLAKGEPFTVCLLPGNYALPSPLRLDDTHHGLTLQGCSGDVTLGPADGAERQFVDGVIVATKAANVTISNLQIVMPSVPFAQAGGKAAGLGVDVFRPVIDLQRFLTSVGIRVFSCDGFTVQDCSFSFPALPAGAVRVIRFAAAVFAGGTCDGLTVRRSTFTGAEPAAAPEGGISLGIGCVLSPSVVVAAEPASGPSERSGGTFFPSQALGASIRDNHFDQLTAAALVMGTRLGVRVEGNVVKRSANGFVFAATEAVTQLRAFPTPAEQLNGQLTPLWAVAADGLLAAGGALARLFPVPAEFTDAGIPVGAVAPQNPVPSAGQLVWPAELLKQLTADIASLYPPADPSVARARAAAVAAAFLTQEANKPFISLNSFLTAFEAKVFARLDKTLPPELSLHCSGNDVEAVSASGASGVALLALGRLGRRAADPSSSDAALVTANRLRSATPGASVLPTAVIGSVRSCTVTGNAVLNDGPITNDLAPVSLVVALTAPGQKAAVTGNVLHGRTVLPAQAPTGWEAFNAIY